MRLTRKLMFAIEAVLDIAYNTSDRPVQSSEIAERQGIPRRYLEHVLQHLVRAEVFVWGPGSTWRLSPSQRAAADIFRANSARNWQVGRKY